MDIHLKEVDVRVSQVGISHPYTELHVVQVEVRLRLARLHPLQADIRVSEVEIRSAQVGAPISEGEMTTRERSRSRQERRTSRLDPSTLPLYF